MPIVVDGFHYGARELSQVYVLTHMHADHYGGLTRSWNSGVIYATAPTVKLVRERFKISYEYLHVVPLNTPTRIAVGNAPVMMTMLDANHCPGAACVLFEMADGSLCLHVGDFRWDRATMLANNPVLKALQYQPQPGPGMRRLASLYLDTTYCDPRYTFPPQQEVIDATVNAITGHLTGSSGSGRGSGSGSTLVLFGAYSLGKERLYMEVARRLGRKVYVDARRHQTLSCLGWASEVMSLLTMDPSATCLWVVPISWIKFGAMRRCCAQQQKALSRGFARVIGVQPTGWTFTGSTGTATDGAGGATGSSGCAGQSLLTCRRQGPDMIYGAPYSEHSSFSELVDCVRYLRPRRIVPTVNCSKSSAQVALLTKAAGPADVAAPDAVEAG